MLVFVGHPLEDATREDQSQPRMSAQKRRTTRGCLLPFGRSDAVFDQRNDVAFLVVEVHVDESDQFIDCRPQPLRRRRCTRFRPYRARGFCRVDACRDGAVFILHAADIVVTQRHPGMQLRPDQVVFGCMMVMQHGNNEAQMRVDDRSAFRIPGTDAIDQFRDSVQLVAEKR